jgi:hypothetical protein
MRQGMKTEFRNQNGNTEYRKMKQKRNAEKEHNN